MHALSISRLPLRSFVPIFYPGFVFVYQLIVLTVTAAAVVHVRRNYLISICLVTKALSPFPVYSATGGNVFMRQESLAGFLSIGVNV